MFYSLARRLALALLIPITVAGAAMSPEIESAQKPNKLADETSPYLLQHAHNPVQWHPWGEEAFEEARERNLPIFLSIGYSASRLGVSLGCGMFVAPAMCPFSKAPAERTSSSTNPLGSSSSEECTSQQSVSRASFASKWARASSLGAGVVWVTRFFNRVFIPVSGFLGRGRQGPSPARRHVIWPEVLIRTTGRKDKIQ